MKLRTEMHNGKVREEVFVGGTSIGLTLCSTDQLTHDAACVHALKQALRCEAPGVYARAIAKADSILREWDFDSGEVE